MSTAQPAKTMAEASPRPLHNAALLTAASLAAKACGFLLFLVMVRRLDVSGVGQYGTIMAVVGLFSVGTDLGLSTLAVRDIAQDRRLLPRYLANILVLRLCLAVAMAAILIVIAVVAYSGVVLDGIVLWGLALIPVAVIGTAGVVFQAIEQMAVLSLLTTVIAAASAVLGIVALLAGGGVMALIAIASGVNLAAAVAGLALAYRVSPWRWRIEVGLWPSLVRAGIPFAVLTLLNVLYSRADMVLVQHIRGIAAAGQYYTAYRLVDTLLVVAISPFNAAALPAFNRVAAASRDALQQLVRSGVRIMLVAGLPVAVAGTVYAREVLRLVAGPDRGDFLAAAPAVAWLAWSFPCFTVLAILYNALYAVHRARDVGRAFAVTLVFNVVLNVVLIPRYSFYASAALTTLSEGLNVLLAGWAVHKHAGSIGALLPVVRVAIATAIMAGVMVALHPLGLYVGVPAGVLAYVPVLYVVRAFGSDEYAILARVPVLGPAIARRAPVAAYR